MQCFDYFAGSGSFKVDKKDNYTPVYPTICLKLSDNLSFLLDYLSKIIRYFVFFPILCLKSYDFLYYICFACVYFYYFCAP